MGLGLLGALAGGYTAISKGIQADNERRIAEDDLAWKRKQRENEEADRQYMLGQRQRQLDEQRRTDQLREDLSNVPTTRQVDARPQGLQDITHDDTTGPDDNTPAATQIPATKTVASPRWLQLQGRADAFRKNREFEKADAYDEAARREQFAEGARRTAQLRSSASGMSLEQLARAAADIYNNDPLPAQVTGIKPTQDGVQLTFNNPSTGRTEVLQAKSHAQLMQGLEAYYSPETYAADQQARRAAAAKADEARLTELYKPVHAKPDERVARFNPGTGKYDVILEGNQVRSGAGAKPGEEFKPADDALDFVAKHTGFKEQMTPEQGALVQRLNRQFYSQNPNIDPTVAAHAAVQAVADPTKTAPKFDPATGKIVSAMPYEGGHFVVRDLGAPGASKDVKPEQLRALATDFVSSIPEEQRNKFVLASFDKSARQQLRNDMEARLRSDEGVAALSIRLGRQATKKDVDAAVDMANQAQQRQLDFIGNHGDPDMKAAAKKMLAGPAPTAPKAAGGLTPGGDAVPAVGGLGLSPTERKTKIDAAVAEKKAADAAAAAKALEATKSAAAAALASKDPRAAQEVQGSAGFSQLDLQTKSAIYKLVNGLR